MDLFDPVRYIIQNRKHKSVAKLCDDNDRSSVVADNNQNDPGEMVSSSISLVTTLASQQFTAAPVED
jgi:hypothetical protein